MKSRVILAFAAACSAIPLQNLQVRDNTTVGISSSLLESFKLYANFTSASYCTSNEDPASTPDTAITCPATVCPLVEAHNATSIVEFGSNDTTLTGIKGYVALDPVLQTITISFAGSGATIRNWLTDFTFAQIPSPLCANCWIHSGFATAWSERRSVVLAAVSSALAANPDFSIVVTGHSIGAAVATLAATELRNLGHSVSTYTFGSPRVGNAAFASFVTAAGSNFRMTHVNDPVPQLPPTWLGYQHTSPEYWLSGSGGSSDAM
ncbi:Mono- and diacylglycerol lipase, partial [Lachnellula suecica]